MTKATLCGGKKKTKTTFVNTKISFKTSQQMRTGLKNGKKKLKFLSYSYGPKKLFWTIMPGNETG